MASNSSQEEAVEVHEDEASSQAKLRFNAALSWRAGKPIVVADLLRRLQALAAELKPIEQGMAHTDSMKPTAKELASSNLLTHKDKGVKAWTATCLVEILRLFAPTAPYTASQLKVCFEL